LSTTTIKLDIETLQKPDNLKAGDVDGENYHRLSVAYGLAHYENCCLTGQETPSPFLNQSQEKSRVK